jgi:hypothetical protein
MLSTATLDPWIERLRSRVERGDLRAHPPLDLGGGTKDLPAERTVRLMLADLAYLDGLTPDATDWPSLPWRRAALLADFWKLRKLIG